MAEKNQQQNLLPYATVGIEFIAIFGMLLGVGLLVDWRLGTTPGLGLLGGVFGFAAGLRHLLRRVRFLRDKYVEQDIDGSGRDS